jgi:hypothetical protein
VRAPKNWPLFIRVQNFNDYIPKELILKEISGPAVYSWARGNCSQKERIISQSLIDEAFHDAFDDVWL